MINTIRQLAFILILGSIVLSCGTSKVALAKKKNALELMIADNPVLKKHFTGFILQDLRTGETLAEQNSHQLFTPASNTKIITLYSSLMTMNDTLPLLHYVETSDALIFGGTGNPYFLNSNFEQEGVVFQFLKDHPKRLLYYEGNFKDDHYGEGWMWDDYNYSFQTEKNSFPIYGNLVQFQLNTEKKLSIEPKYFAQYSFKQQADKEVDDLYVTRKQYSNDFRWYYPDTMTVEDEIFKPFHYDYGTFLQLLGDTLNRKINSTPSLPPDIKEDIQTLNKVFPDTIYQRLIKDSDNFVAEQLMLMVSDKVLGYQNTEDAIAYSMEHYLSDVADELRWVDGSGISRYNLVSPSALVSILKKVDKKLQRERLLSIFPQGQVEGTLKGYYGPYVWAKTGTLRHCHNLSGYIKTQKGKWYVFSFMNNHFSDGSKEVKEEMGKILEWIYDNY